MKHLILTTLLILSGPQEEPDYAAHVKALKKRLPHPDFHIVVQPPFVVVGDGRPNDVDIKSRRTVRWAVDLLKKDYFEKDPDHIIDVWLFKDRRSYETNVRKLWNERPTTKFGYYSRRHRALVMNIATGGGTLVHEIVHPFMAANFPECPSWFNEGLASLYEQCGEVDGKIHGYTNWRLKDLQRIIRKGDLPTIEWLFSTTTEAFYGDHSGRNYAMARYLLYHLQQKKLLRRFWKEFTANVGKDPTGYASFRKVLGRKDMKAYQEEWEAFVLKLEY